MDDGATQLRVAEVSPPTTDNEVAAEAVVAGVDDATELATPPVVRLRAVTRNEYVVPFVSPAIEALRTGAPVSAIWVVHETPSVEDSTRYPVIVRPAAVAGATHERATLRSPATAVTEVGADGVPSGTAKAWLLDTPTEEPVRTLTRYV